MKNEEDSNLQQRSCENFQVQNFLYSHDSWDEYVKQRTWKTIFEGKITQKKLKISNDSDTTTISISVWDTIKVNTTKLHCRDVSKCGQDIRTNLKHCNVTSVQILLFSVLTHSNT